VERLLVKERMNGAILFAYGLYKEISR